MRTAAILIFGVAAITALSAALLPSRRSYLLAVQQQSLHQAAQGTTLDPTSLIDVIVGVVLGVEIIIAGLWLLWGIKVRQGRNWARVVATIFAIIAILDFAGGIVRLMGFEHPPLYAYVIDLAAIIFDIAILFLLWQRVSGQWFKACTMWRRQRRRMPSYSR